MSIAIRLRSMTALLLASTFVASPLAAQPAGWHNDGRQFRPPMHGYYHGHRDDGGAVLGGALLGLGVGALVGSALAQPNYAPPPPVYYAPQPPGAYYGPPPGAYYPQ
jgi:hypothetical protein